jgi:hypothetical protein
MHSQSGPAYERKTRDEGGCQSKQTVRTATVPSPFVMVDGQPFALHMRRPSLLVLL